MTPTRIGARARAAVVISILAATAGCSRSAPAQQGAPPPVPIRAGVVVKRDVPVEIPAIGTVEAYSTVEIQAQVSGVLETVHFREGQDVRRGDLLFSIDPRPFESALDAARAKLARDSIQLKTAQQDAARYGDLVAKDYVTKEEFDRIQTTAGVLEATVRSDEADVENATLLLEYCSIRSPIDGRTGRLVVHAGNLVRADSGTALVVINQTTPVYVSFYVPEVYLDEIRKQMAAGPLEVRAALSGDAGAPAPGRLSFVDNAVDRRTGTVLLKAIFPNDDKILWPGRFVDVTLKVATRPGALLVPSQAIQTGQQGLYLYVIKPDNTVESRGVVTGPAVGPDTVIEKGAEEGEKVVTDGQLRLAPGARVEIKP